MSSNEVPSFDTSGFSQDSYAKRIEKPWGHELHWTPANLPYVGKILCIDAGKQLSLQIHDQKRESWLIMEGRAKVVWEDNSGQLSETELEPGLGYSTSVGQRHRLVGITACKIIEVSTPEEGTTWRLEDDYQRPHETETQRAIERGE